MVDLRRHQLVKLTRGGWCVILERQWDTQARECLEHWAARGLPLVVTRQATNSSADGSFALGLSAPSRWGCRKLAVRVQGEELLELCDFPYLGELLGTLPSHAYGPMHRLTEELEQYEAPASVFGSYGWQAICGCDHVRAGSDLDLAVPVEGAEHADAIADLLHCYGDTSPRLDGELIFGNGAAVAWREWRAWRAGRAQAVLVKQLDGVSLQRDALWCGRRGSVEAVS